MAPQGICLFFPHPAAVCESQSYSRNKKIKMMPIFLLQPEDSETTYNSLTKYVKKKNLNKKSSTIS